MNENNSPEAPLPLPPSGGSWVRNPDGSLSREPGTEPPQGDSASQQPQEE